MTVIAVVTAAEVVQSLVAIFVADKTVFGALPVAGEEHIAFVALLRERVEFVVAEGKLLL